MFTISGKRVLLRLLIKIYHAVGAFFNVLIITRLEKLVAFVIARSQFFFISNNVIVCSEPSDSSEVDVVFCCAFSARYEILELSILETMAANNSRKIRWILAGSSAEDGAFIQKMKTKYTYVDGILCANKPLGRKWQTCVAHARKSYESDLYAIIGSDDIVPHRSVDALLLKREADIQATKNIGLYCCDEWLIADFNPSCSNAPGIYHCQIKENIHHLPLGAGRFYTKKFADLYADQLFSEYLNRKLDNEGYELVRSSGMQVSFIKNKEFKVVSVKGAWKQMNSMETILSSPNIQVSEVSFDACAQMKKLLLDEVFESILSGRTS